MGWRDSLANWLAPNRNSLPFDIDDYPRGDFERALESGETNRLNEGHWSAVRDQPINEAIAHRGNMVRARANHESWNNPHDEGLVHQHTIAVVGENGPISSITSLADGDDDWCESAQQVLDEWAGYCDAAGIDTLGTRIKNFWNRGCWVNGEWIDQLWYDRSANTTSQLRLHSVEPQRLCTPSDSANDESVTLGVHRTPTYAPIRYYIADDWGFGYRGNWYPASRIMHGFERREGSQARGVPWMQSGLPTSADVRDYDDQVMDAARSFADHAIVAQTKHQDAPYAPLAKNARAQEIRRRRINFLPPTWELANLQANQPGAQYKEHRQERLGSLGLGQGVPSMMVRLDARDHNYSSARFDRGNLHESARHVRASIYNPKLTRLYRLVIAEAVLGGVLGPPPKFYTINHIWPAMPQIDEDKSSRAEERYLEIGTLSYSETCAMRHGRRGSDMIRERARDRRQLASAGLPAMEDLRNDGGDTKTAKKIAEEIKATASDED